MAQCKAQHTVGTEVRYCIYEAGDHDAHRDYLDVEFAAEPVDPNVEIVYFAEIDRD